MMPKAVVLLSGGLDSSVNLGLAHQEHEVALALTFDYGQRAAKREIQATQNLCQHYSVPHKVLSLPWFKDFTSTGLVNPQATIPTAGDVRIDDLDKSHKTASQVWVPNRNGIFLNIAAAFAESLGAEFVIPGFNAEEGATFPDNTWEFMQATSAAFWFSTQLKGKAGGHVSVKCYTHGWHKVEIVKKGQQIGVPLELVWSCYFDERCGQCESCLRFERAIKEARP